VVFACNWCSYAGADTAGVLRIQHQPHFRMIRVMCSGRIEPAFVLRAFERGADGVLVSGCHFGDCHYVFGNHRAAEQFAKTQRVVKLLGLETGRLRLEWISAAEGARFAKVIDEFTEQVRQLGPSPLASTAQQKAPDPGGPEGPAAEEELAGVVAATAVAAEAVPEGVPTAATRGAGTGTGGRARAREGRRKS
jgi:F420-non-reducing hydrogenase iron-sulfur subunit